eukprot:TRINITY_DN15197_c0_g1::TRINITY_DN15197_c0_g1_i1::g.30713::m.30713 TRINITY_DN15197_c0_g1::TRINITY_DN15197_c0_g1_i1::g.30713  ORF type:complete len:814 (-),score=200.36,sp/Q9ULJ7/ANR50_HUMAN/30.14/9e-20,sp/Q9ULJ7/ANR50_HUMAN/26.53/4e-08,sp/Q9ULJ7/ANR50_HUMAN/26.52/1e-07,sp/Q9ULJ7/ANR50_HUMAN/26.86/1e-06,Ank_2/PF12796.2/4.6e-10,Ank_2/PF12796.2/5.2e-05,Ank_2/PF12796.2/9.4e-08,Ank/PF00023.25/4.2e-05,Ank/PF00023.25/0.082,Ank/PF00023.25/33,Ank/PF00023.25/34,Ank/PF00023.25/7.6e-05,Ank/PF00023.25/3.4e+03
MLRRFTQSLPQPPKKQEPEPEIQTISEDSGTDLAENETHDGNDTQNTEDHLQNAMDVVEEGDESQKSPVSSPRGHPESHTHLQSPHSPRKDDNASAQMASPTPNTNEETPLSPSPEESVHVPTTSRARDASDSDKLLVTICGIWDLVEPDPLRTTIWTQQVKKETGALFKRSVTFFLFLFSDLLLLCKPHTDETKAHLKYKIAESALLKDIVGLECSSEKGSTAFDVVTRTSRFEVNTQSEANRAHIMRLVATAVIDLRYPTSSSTHGAGSSDENEVPSTELEDGETDTARKAAPWVSERYGAEHEILRGSLLSASYLGDCDYVASILERAEPAFLNQQDEASGASALHLAAARGHGAVAALLLSRGASVMCDRKGVTPVHIAAYGGAYSVIDAIVDSGRNTSQTDVNGRVPLHYAVQGAIEAKALAHDDPFAESRYHKTILSLMTAAPDDAQTCDHYGLTPLHAGVFGGVCDAVCAMIRGGAQVRSYFHTLPTSSHTPLHTATLADCIDMVRILVKAGSNMNVRDYSGATPLFLAPSSPVRVFLALYGARPDMCPEFPWQSAEEEGEVTRSAMIFKNLTENTPVLDTELLPRYTFPFNEARVWMDDNMSSKCTICEALFTTTFRRHHCRHCGGLVCSNCHTRKASLKSSLSKEGMVATPRPQQHAVCDGCFNYIYLNATGVSVEDDHVVKSVEERRATIRRTHQLEREQLLGPASSSMSSPRGSDAIGGGKSRSDIQEDARKDWSETMKEAEAQNAKDVMERNKQKLLENQEKLKRTQERSEQMRHEAMTFADNCKRLAEQQKKKDSFWGLL